MNKLLKLFLSVLLCASIVTCISASATITNTPKLKVRCYTMEGRHLIDVKVSTDFSAAALSGTVTMSSTAAVEYLSHSIGAAADGNHNNDGYQVYDSGKAVNFGIFGDIINGSIGDWVSITYERKVMDGMVQLSIDSLVASDTQGNRIVMADPDAVEIQLGWNKGDANGDLSVDIHDMVRLIKINAGSDTSDILYEYNCDLDGDGVAGDGDLVMLKQNLLSTK